MDDIYQGDLFLKKWDDTYEKVMNITETMQVTLTEDEDNEEVDRIFGLLTNPMEFSFTAKIDPVERFRFEVKMLGGAYWIGKVPRVIRRKKDERMKS